MKAPLPEIKIGLGEKMKSLALGTLSFRCVKHSDVNSQ